MFFGVTILMVFWCLPQKIKISPPNRSLKFLLQSEKYTIVQSIFIYENTHAKIFKF